jgi:hypothetical protein
MRFAEIAGSPWILATTVALTAIALRPGHRTTPPAVTPIVDVQPVHETTMEVDDCASNVDLVDGHYVVTLRIPDAERCTTAVRVYHLENDQLVFEAH